jgi:hypothetical protein
MSDEKKSELTDSQRKHGKWDDAAEAAYVAERNQAAANRIFGAIDKGINPVTGRAIRKTVVERGKGPHRWTRTGYDPHHHWKTPRRDGENACNGPRPWPRPNTNTPLHSATLQRKRPNERPCGGAGRGTIAPS